jgi:hypothetical protein
MNNDFDASIAKRSFDSSRWTALAGNRAGIEMPFHAVR